MSRSIPLGTVRQAARNNLICFKSLLKILSESDTAAKDLACGPLDPNCPNPTLEKRDCWRVADRPGATVVDALAIILRNQEVFLDILERLEGPPIPVPEDWDLNWKPAETGA